MKYFILVIWLLFLYGCSVVVPSDSQQAQNDASAIGVCGGGLEQGIKTSIEAEYEKVTGRLDAGFSRYIKTVLDANGVSEAKYDKYIKCVLEIDKRQREKLSRYLKNQSCKNSCKTNKNSCEIKLSNEFDECISNQMSGCYRDCRRRGLSIDECRGKLCSWTDLDKKAKAFYTNVCNKKENYLELSSSCSGEFASCKTLC